MIVTHQSPPHHDPGHCRPAAQGTLAQCPGVPMAKAAIAWVEQMRTVKMSKSSRPALDVGIAN